MKLRLHHAKLNFIYNRVIGPKLKRNCLMQDNISFTHRNVLNFVIVFELGTWSRYPKMDWALGDCLSLSEKLTEKC